MKTAKTISSELFIINIGDNRRNITRIYKAIKTTTLQIKQPTGLAQKKIS